MTTSPSATRFNVENLVEPLREESWPINWAVLDAWDDRDDEATSYTSFEALRLRAGQTYENEDGAERIASSEMFAVYSSTDGWQRVVAKDGSAEKATYASPDERPEGPQANFIWPVTTDLDPLDAAYQIRHLPLCVVEMDGIYGLSLTGGGQDFSWQIAMGFLLLGYFPPMGLHMPSGDWKYGVGEISEVWANRVRDALLARYSHKIQALKHSMDWLYAWNPPQL